MHNRLLFAFGSTSSLRVQLEIANHAEASGWATGFLFWGENPGQLQRIRELVPNTPVSAPNAGANDQDYTVASHPSLSRARLVSLVAHRLGETMARYQAAALSRATLAITDFAPDAMIVSEDGISSDLRVIAAAKNLQIPVIDVPYGFGVRRDLEIELESKAARGELLMPEGRAGSFLRYWAPQWLKRGAFADALMFPTGLILSLEALGITLRDAWIIHGGLSDRLCAENLVSQTRYVEEGIPLEKIVLTGSPYCDEMKKAVEADPQSAAALRTGRPIDASARRVLVSWPPSYHEARPGSNEFGSYEEMTVRVLTSIKEIPNCKLIVSLHPATAVEVREILARHAINISDEHIISLIPRSDIYVTYFSSTIRWAIAAGKPVLNYDAYDLKLDVYDSAPGFQSVKTCAELEECLKRLVTSEVDFGDMAERQCAVAGDWGILDGKCSERILEIAEELIRKKRRSFSKLGRR